MPEVTKGTAHIFGIGASITNLTLTEVNLEPGFALDQKTPDQNGVTIENRMDDRTITGSISGYMQAGYTIPKQGDVITLDGLTDTDLNTSYVIKSKPQAYRAGEKVQLTLNLESHEGINYSGGGG